MTDEQILRRLAEIEGWTCRFTSDGPDRFYANDAKSLMDFKSPLTLWSDCGPLVDKYRPKMRHLGEWWDVKLGDAHENGPDLKRAICMAIIESKREK